MRSLPQIEAVWRSGDYVGNRRPMVRATVQVPSMALRHYSVISTLRPAPTTTDSSWVHTEDRTGPTKTGRVSQTYADFMFTPKAFPKELPNIRSVSWNRSLDQDVATMTMELYNSKPRPVTDAIPSPLPVSRRDLDHPGHYTFDHGRSTFSRRWGHTTNEWFGMLMPDNLIRTFEGYGLSRGVSAEYDVGLAQTGVWIIDSIVLNALGIIVVNCRDLGRLLLDHQANRPVIPLDFHPLWFKTWDLKPPTPAVRTRIPLRISDTSNRYGPYRGADGVYVHPNLPDPDNYRGMPPTNVLDDNAASMWLSYAQPSGTKPYAMEWLEVGMDPARVESLKLWLLGSGYTCYISVFADGSWRNKKGKPAGSGDPKVRWSPNPQNPRTQPARVPYVKSFVAGKAFAARLTTVDLPVPIAKVTKIRVSFRNLQVLPVAPRTPKLWRLGIRSLSVYGGTTPGTPAGETVGPAGSNPGRYRDYTDIVKLCCAWAGFFWPRGGMQKTADGRTYRPYYTKGDWDLGVDGRIWGDFEPALTTGPAEFTPDNLENKSLMDVISMVRDVIPFVFFIDEVGSVQWRLPNIYKPGNWLNNIHMNASRTGRVLVIDEKQVLLSVDSTLSSNNVREIIRLTNFTDTAEAKGFVPNNVGLRRVLLWADPLLEKTDLQRGADMTAVRSMFLWRRDRVVIPGFPGLQLDDQVQIFERVTDEGYYHYVKGMSSSNNLETGEWTYTLDTTWLGDKHQVRWVIPPDDRPGGVRPRPGEPGWFHTTPYYGPPGVRRVSDPI